eukprot:Pgem_evm1s9232
MMMMSKKVTVGKNRRTLNVKMKMAAVLNVVGKIVARELCPMFNTCKTEADKKAGYYGRKPSATDCVDKNGKKELCS